MRSAILGTAVAYLVVAGVELTWHWYAGAHDTGPARAMRAWYVHRDEVNGKFYNDGFADLIFPAIAFGAIAGSITARSRQGPMAASLLIFCLGLVALFPVYGVLVPDSLWSRVSAEDRVLGIATSYGKACLLALFFAVAGRACTQQYQGRKPDCVP